MEQEQINQAVDKIKKDTEELSQIDTVKELIKNNAIEFEQLGVKYRIKKPTFEQKQTVNNERMKKFVEMLKNPEMLLEADLVKLYEQRGISIKELDDRFNVLKKQREDYAMKLGKALTEKKEESELKVFKEEIEKIISEQDEISMRKSVLLDASIESQINVFVYTFMSFVITEKLVEDKWVRAWTKYDEFMQQDESLVNRLTWYAALIGRSDIPLS